MAKMTLEVLSPNGVIFTDIVDSILVKGVDGELGILAGHVPLFTELSMGVLTYKKGKEENYIAVMGGFLEVNANKVNIITTSGEVADNIDKARALQDKDSSDKLAMKKAGDESFQRAQREVAKANIRLKAIELLERSGRRPRM